MGVNAGEHESEMEIFDAIEKTLNSFARDEKYSSILSALAKTVTLTIICVDEPDWDITHENFHKDVQAMLDDVRKTFTAMSRQVSH